MKSRTLRWMDGLRVVGAPFGRFRMSASTDDTIFTSCFAAFLYELLGEMSCLEPQRRQEWLDFILSYQNEETGLFVDQTAQQRNLRDGHDMHYVNWQLSAFCLSAIRALGGKIRYPLQFLESGGYQEPEKVRQTLESFNWRNPWGSGNLAMFLGVFLLWRAELNGEGTNTPAVQAFFDWHDSYQNPRTGFWGEGWLSHYHNGLFGAYHQYLLYFYSGRDLHYKEQIIDRILSFQNLDGMFAPQLGGGGCEDIDAIDTLVQLYLRTGYRENDVKRCLNRASRAIRALESPSGGFIWGVRERHGLAMYARNILSLWKQADLYKWIFVNRRFLREQIDPLKPRHPQGWISKGIPVDESDLFSTWFRLLALIYCSTVIESPLSKGEWHFLEAPGLGWFKPPAKGLA